MIRKQKYLELLEEAKFADALQVLQFELTPLKINTDELYRLSRYTSPIDTYVIP